MMEIKTKGFSRCVQSDIAPKDVVECREHDFPLMRLVLIPF